MEVTIDTLIAILSLFVGGGGGAFFTWRWQRRRAKAEAQQAETSAAKEMQDMYQQMIADANGWMRDSKQHNDELRQDRDHYKHDRNELRTEVEQLQRSLTQLQTEGEQRTADLQRTIARLGRKVDAMVPFICGRAGCKDRVPAIVSPDGELKIKTTPKARRAEKSESEATLRPENLKT